MRRRVAGALMAVVIVLAAGGLTIECQAQAKIPRVGVLALSEATLKQPWYSSFTRGLAERGWVPGKNVVIEYRFARGEDSRFSDAAERLVQLKVDVIFALSAPATHAAHAATATVPIVAQDYTNDPVAVGYAESYSRPGPIERPNKFDFVFNMKTIKALGLKIPDSLLPGAEQVGR